jgi:hypothetical protein
MPWRCFLTINALNVKNRILVVERLVRTLWTKGKGTLNLSNLSVLTVVRFLSRTVPNMVKNILSLNVSFAVVLLNGSAGTLWFNSGVIPTSVRVVTKSNVRVSISASIRRTSFRNVKGRPDVLLEEIIKATVMKNLWDVLSAEILNRPAKVSEWNCWSLWLWELPN